MKTVSIKTALFLFIAGPVLLLSSCSNQEAEKRRKALNDFSAYVDERKDSLDRYMDRKWDELENEYNEKKAALDKDKDKMDKAMQEKYNRTVEDWESVKHNYEARYEERQHHERMATFASSLVPSGVNHDMSNVTATNIAGVYEHFVNKVDANKEAYSKEEWTAVNDCWKSLNNMKDQLDKDKAISKKDETTIAKVKFKYAGIISTYKPFAESEVEKSKS